MDASHHAKTIKIDNSNKEEIEETHCSSMVYHPKTPLIKSYCVGGEGINHPSQKLRVKTKIHHLM